MMYTAENVQIPICSMQDAKFKAQLEKINAPDGSIVKDVRVLSIRFVIPDITNLNLKFHRTIIVLNVKSDYFQNIHRKTFTK